MECGGWFCFRRFSGWRVAKGKDLVGAFDASVFEGRASDGFLGCDVGWRDVPNVAEQLFKAHGRGQRDSGQVGGFCLD